MRKIGTIAIVLIVLCAGVFLYGRGRENGQPNIQQYTFDTLPTKDNPSPHGLYSNVPPFEEWEWKEEYDDEGELVYRIKLPPAEEYVGGVNDNYLDGYWNKARISKGLPGVLLENNIQQYYTVNKKGFLVHGTINVGTSTISKYWTHRSYDTGGGTRTDRFYILTKKNLLSTKIDFEECSRFLKYEYDSELKFSLCIDYHSTYLPIVDKALETLEIPNYVDDRGFVPENERKTLTKQFYEAL